MSLALGRLVPTSSASFISSYSSIRCWSTLFSSPSIKWKPQVSTIDTLTILWLTLLLLEVGFILFAMTHHVMFLQTWRVEVLFIAAIKYAFKLVSIILIIISKYLNVIRRRFTFWKVEIIISCQYFLQITSISGSFRINLPICHEFANVVWGLTRKRIVCCKSRICRVFLLYGYADAWSG